MIDQGKNHDITWFLEDDGTLILKGHGKMESDDDNDVMYYEHRFPWFPYKDEITSLIVEEGVINIGADSFFDFPNLSKVILPKSLREIDYGAFARCISLTNIDIYDNVSYIGPHAFMNCKNLQKVRYPSSLSLINELLFCGCDKLESFHISDNVKEIKNHAFMNCKSLKEIIIPDSVEIIGASAFEKCGAERLIVGKGLKRHLGFGMFGYMNNLKEIIVDQDNPYYCSKDGIAFSKDMKTLILYPRNKEGQSYHIPKSVIYLDEHAFDGNLYLETINIPNTVKEISTYVFHSDHLKDIYYDGTQAQWDAIKHRTWAFIPDTVTIHLKND